MELVRRLLVDAAALNTQHFPPSERHGAMVGNVAGYIIALLATLFGILYSLHDLPTWKQVIAWNAFLAFSGLVTPLSQSAGRWGPPVWLAFASSIDISALAWIFGSQSGVMLNLIVAPPLALMILGPRRVWLAALISLYVGAVLVLGTIWFDYSETPVWTKGAINIQILICGIATGMILPFSVVYYALRAAERAESARRNLLDALMPEQIVDELLRNGSHAIVRSIEKATVCFADISGFVALSTLMGPERTVAMLDDLFGRFDEIAATLGIEKVKTIGDAYLAAAGVPEPMIDPDRAIAQFCFAIMKEARRAGERHGIDLNMRIGFATGPVTAGVIGRAKYSYDIWGTTVNLAARLEAVGHPREVVTTGQVRGALDDYYDFELMGTEEMKGLGPQQVWRIRERPEISA